MTDPAITVAATPPAPIVDSVEVPAEGTRRGRSSGLVLLNVGCWLVFGAAMMVGSLDVAPWDVILASESVYVVIGFLLSILLGVVYDRLNVGSASFGRALAVIVAASCVAGMLWNVGFYYHRHYGAATLHSLIIGAPSRLGFRREWILDGALEHCVLPLLGWSLA